jgi:DNA-binding transcriptional LysR family regulator
METQHIKYIRCVSEHENISAAARELGMTQPALTKIVSRVEDLVGARLFNRGPRGVTLTPFGELYLRRMEKVEQEMLNLATEVHACKSGASGTVSLGVGQFWLGSILPKVVGQLARTFPDIHVKIRTGPRTELLERLKKGELDYTLGRITDDLPEELVGELLAEVRFFLVARQGHPLLELKRPVTPQDIAPYGWVLPPRDDPTVHFAFVEQGLEPPPTRVEAISYNLVIGILHETDFVTVMPEMMMNQMSEGLARLPADWLGASRSAGVIRVKERALLPCCDSFLDLLRAEMGGPDQSEIMLSAENRQTSLLSLT